MIDPSRSHDLNELPECAGKYVLYWMQQSQRTRYNHALEAAIFHAKKLDLPIVVCFGLMDDYPDANERSYLFLLEGLRDVELALRERGIRFVVKHGPPPQAALHFGEAAAVIFCDRGYLRHQRRWRDEVADHATCRVVEVESDVVVPVEVASDKHEFAARTIRPKIHKKWDEYLKPLKHAAPKHDSTRMKIDGDINVTDPESALKKLKVDRGVKASPIYRGGEVEAQKRLRHFVSHFLNNYDEGRNEPAADHTSKMSMYLHYGHISPIEIALAVRDSKNGAMVDRAGYMEELIIRRELSMNFCWFQPKYDSYDCLPDWAKKTLADHAADDRPVQYSLKQLESADTKDPYWNAAQKEMVFTGFMHNYMRMYWGKKILEWTKDPRTAFEHTLYLNNKYELDGRDANSYANIAWIYGLHDRPWGRRSIFGTVRYMNAAGLERKFDMAAYVRRVESLARE